MSRYLIILPFALFFIFLLNLNLVNAAVSCNSGECYVSDLGKCIKIGDRYGNKYCNFSNSLADLKVINTACLNNYECLNYNCREGICQSRYSITPPSFFESIVNIFIGTPTKCFDSSDCAADQICDIKNHICVAKPVEPNTPNGGGGGGGGTGTCRSNWLCTNWSYESKQCGVRSCRDLNHCPNSTMPPITKYCSPDTTPLNPSEPPPIDDRYCGNEVCDNNENCENCPYDCVDDCENGGSESFGIVWFLIILILAILLLGIIIVILYNKKYKNTDKEINLKKIMFVPPKSEDKKS